MKYLKKTDSQIYNLIKKEEKRQKETLMMIPSENIASGAVEEAVGSVLANKYAEGYPEKRYYQGQRFVDQIEKLAIERAKKLFNVPFVNVQPYSGSPANSAVFFALLKPKDKIMGLGLAFGGHLTHGSAVSFSGKYFSAINYPLTEQGIIDYDFVEKEALKQRPKIIIAGTTAYPLIIDWQRFARISQKINAYLLADISHLAGLVAAGVYPSPVPFADIITTTTHKTLRGPRGAMIMVSKKGLEKDPELPDKINRAVFPGLQGGPHINTIAGIAVALKEASKSSFKKYAKQIINNAKTLAKELKKYQFQLVGNGTESHLILVDLRNKEILGNLAAEGLEAANIILNRNAIPFDPNPPFYPSGIRLGTPGLTSRGMKQKEMVKVAQFINLVIDDLVSIKNKMRITVTEEKKLAVRKKIINRSRLIKLVKQEVKKLCQQFPIKKLY